MAIITQTSGVTNQVKTKVARELDNAIRDISAINAASGTAPTLAQVTAQGATTATATTFSGGVSNQNGLIKPFKSYVAQLDQPGDTSAPVATVMENNLGGAIVWTRTGVGEYLGTLTGAFTVNKTAPDINMLPLEIGSEVVPSFKRASANTMTLNVYEADGSTPSEGFTATVFITVYN